MRDTDLAHRASGWLDVDPIVEIVLDSQWFITDNAVLGAHGGWCDDPVLTLIGRVLKHKCQMLNELVVAQRRVRWLIFDQPRSVERVEESPREQIPDHAIKELFNKRSDGVIFDLVPMKRHFDGSGFR